MVPYGRSSILRNGMLPVDIVLHPAWWHRYAGLTFDRDFFYHPKRRVEAERRMEEVLFDRFGSFGLGADRKKDLPLVGAVHNAAGYLVSEMLGCEVVYQEDAPPQVLPAHRENLVLDAEAALKGTAFQRFYGLCESLKARFGYLLGDVNFGGILNCALDLRGQDLFLDFNDRPEEVRAFFSALARVIDGFTRSMVKETGSTSISVNRTVRHLSPSLFLHSECCLTMISIEHYQAFLFSFDESWSRNRRPFGIHYCGEDPDRFAEVFAQLPHLDFLDVGWGGDFNKLRAHLPETFLNIRLSPMEMAEKSEEEIRRIVTRLVKESGNPYLTGVCCINMDDRVEDKKIAALFETVETLREEYAVKEKGR
jgi:hypothetical protein